MKSKKIKYEYAEDLQKITEDVSRFLYPHIKINRVRCFRSYGSSSKRTIARCHALGKVMQMAVGVDAHYAIEFISERFDKLSNEEQIKTIIHELMHIPKTFGGGFRHHDFVCEKNVNKHYISYKKKKSENQKQDFLGLDKFKLNNQKNLDEIKEVNDEENFF